MKKIILTAALITAAIIFIFMHTAGTPAPQATSFSGLFSLTGMREMAGGFKFDSSGTFEFYFVYGAADRTADGRFTVEGNTIKLHSSKEPGKDFTVTRQSREGAGFRITVKHPDLFMASTVRCLVQNGTTQQWFNAGNDGIIHINLPQAEKMYLQHELFPDVVTLIKDEKNGNNQFEVTLNNTLPKLSFKGVELTISGDTLHMLPNYFMPFENIRFVRVK